MENLSEHLNNLHTNNPGINLFLFSTTTLGAIISQVTASNIAACLTIILGIFGIINYVLSIKKVKLELKKLKREEDKNNI